MIINNLDLLEFVASCMLQNPLGKYSFRVVVHLINCPLLEIPLFIFGSPFVPQMLLFGSLFGDLLLIVWKLVLVYVSPNPCTRLSTSFDSNPSMWDMEVADFSFQAANVCQRWVRNPTPVDLELLSIAFGRLCLLCGVAFVVTYCAGYIRRRYLQNHVKISRLLLWIVFLLMDVAIGAIQGTLLLDNNLGGPLLYYFTVAAFRVISVFWQNRLCYEQRHHEMSEMTAAAAAATEAAAVDEIAVEPTIETSNNTVDATIEDSGSNMEASASDEELEAILNPSTDLMSDWKRLRGLYRTDKFGINTKSLAGHLRGNTFRRLVSTFSLYFLYAFFVISTIIEGSIDTSRWEFWVVCALIAVLNLQISLPRIVTPNIIAKLKKARAQELLSNGTGTGTNSKLDENAI